MFAITIFWFSFIAIVVMLLFKLVEEHVGGVHWWAKFIARADRKIHEYMKVLHIKYRLWKKIAYIFTFEFLPAYAYEQTIKLKDYIYKKYHSSAGSLRGEKRMLRGNGSVSEFLQNITEEERQHQEEALEKEVEKGE